MNWLRQRPVLVFLLRFTVLFSLALMPIPWLADSYTTLYGAGTNCLLSAVDREASIGARFDPPEAIRAQGSWLLVLRVVDRDTGAVATPRLNVRIFSYLPNVMYLALAVASQQAGWRRCAKVLGTGLPTMLVITTTLSSLPVLAKFAAGGLLGEVPATVVETLYQAFATPIMMYAIPLLLWWLMMGVTRPSAPSMHEAQ